MANTLPTSTPAWFIQNLVSGSVDLSDSPSGTFRFGTYNLPPPLPDTALLVQNLYISCEPVLLIYLSGNKRAEEDAARFGVPPPSAPVPVWAYTVSRVLKVGGGRQDEKFKEGDLVAGVTGWARYAVMEKKGANLLRPLPGLSPSVFLGALGMNGLTGYFCLVEKLNPKPTDTLVVSGAAGAVGNVVVQYAKKVLGVNRVVGIAGSDEKGKWLRSIGADATVNYKSKTFAEDLKNAAPNGIDKFFDNVGGPILDEVLLQANPGAVIGICGRMAAKGSDSVTLNNFGAVIRNSLEIKGFTLMNYMNRIEEGSKALAAAAFGGKLTIEGAETLVDLSEKFEDIPKIWHWLFEGKNTGKLVIKLAD